MIGRFEQVAALMIVLGCRTGWLHLCAVATALHRIMA
jgi:hypothetical protein